MSHQPGMSYRPAIWTSAVASEVESDPVTGKDQAVVVAQTADMRGILGAQYEFYYGDDGSQG
jgi:hypothetical protein